MKSAVRNTIRRLFGAVLAAAPIISALPSCESIYDDLPPCDHGVSLRFVYDYNMEYADAFPSKVDCLTLLVYDADGRYVGTYTETGEALRREGYRMKLDLEPGVYRFVAYGGMACEKASFGFVQEPAEGSQMSDLRTALDADCLSDDDRRNLHPLYWGALTLPTGDLYNEGVVRMMKDTNNIRIVLQQMSGDKVDVDDFDFEITDDNTLFGVDNLTIPCGEVLYRPWARGQTSMGITDGGREASYDRQRAASCRAPQGRRPQHHRPAAEQLPDDAQKRALCRHAAAGVPRQAERVVGGILPQRRYVMDQDRHQDQRLDCAYKRFRAVKGKG